MREKEEEFGVFRLRHCRDSGGMNNSDEKVGRGAARLRLNTE